MSIIRIRYKGRIYTREVGRKQGFWIVYSKGDEYWFGKDIVYNSKRNYGWHIVNGKSLPEEFLEQIAEQLERLYQNRQ